MPQTLYFTLLFVPVRCGGEADTNGCEDSGGKGKRVEIAENDLGDDAYKPQRNADNGQPECCGQPILPEQEQSCGRRRDCKEMPRVGQDEGYDALEIFAAKLRLVRSGGGNKLLGTIVAAAEALVDELISCAADLFRNVLVYRKLLGFGVKLGFALVKSGLALGNRLPLRVEPRRTSGNAAAHGVKLRICLGKLRLGGLKPGFAEH